MSARVFPGLGPPPLTRARTAAAIRTLLAIGAVLLLLGCANVANLLMFRVARRAPEIALRQVLGASRSRLMQSQMMESWLLSIAGASLGLVLAWYLKEVIERLLFPAAAGLSVTVPMDWRVLGLTALVAVATGTLAALAPGWLMARTRGLPSQGRTTTWSGAPRLRGSLGVVQLAFSLTLLVSALLLVATLRNLRAVDLGLDPRDVHVVAFNLDQHGYDSARALAYHRAVLPSLRSTGEFEAVSVSTRAPFGSRSSVGVIPPGGEPDRPVSVAREWRQRRLLPAAVDPDPARPRVHRRGCVRARPARAGGRERDGWRSSCSPASTSSGGRCGSPGPGPLPSAR